MALRPRTSLDRASNTQGECGKSEKLTSRTWQHTFNQSFLKTTNSNTNYSQNFELLLFGKRLCLSRSHRVARLATTKCTEKQFFLPRAHKLLCPEATGTTICQSHANQIRKRRPLVDWPVQLPGEWTVANTTGKCPSQGIRIYPKAGDPHAPASTIKILEPGTQSPTSERFAVRRQAT